MCGIFPGEKCLNCKCDDKTKCFYSEACSLGKCLRQTIAILGSFWLLLFSLLWGLSEQRSHLTSFPPGMYIFPFGHWIGKSLACLLYAYRDFKKWKMTLRVWFSLTSLPKFQFSFWGCTAVETTALSAQTGSESAYFNCSRSTIYMIISSPFVPICRAARGLRMQCNAMLIIGRRSRKLIQIFSCPGNTLLPSVYMAYRILSSLLFPNRL